MTKTKRLVEVQALCCSAAESITRSEAKNTGYWYNTAREDSKASVIERLKIARAEILQVMKELEENK